MFIGCLEKSTRHPNT